MALPWLQIVQLVPSIVDVSRELLKKNKQQAPPPPPGTPQSQAELVARVRTLEENERTQAELVSRMAEQISVLTRTLVELRARVLWLMGGSAIAIVVALIAIFVAASR